MSVTDAAQQNSTNRYFEGLIANLQKRVVALEEKDGADSTRAHTEGYEAAVRDVVAWLREFGNHGRSGADNCPRCVIAAEIEREFKP